MTRPLVILSAPPVSETLDKLEQRIGYRFANRKLLVEALTHSSFLADNPDSGPHNQRLEFLGDSVLQFILTDALYHEFLTEREGVLSRGRAMLAKGRFLTQMARELGIEAAIHLGKSEEDSGGRHRASILEDAFEALVGAIYLDSDLTTIRGLVLYWYGPLAPRLAASSDGDNPKGRLQELIQPVHGNRALAYAVSGTSGPLHARIYEVEVRLNGERLGTGTGSSKKAAEEAAARVAVEALKAKNA